MTWGAEGLDAALFGHRLWMSSLPELMRVVDVMVWVVCVHMCCFLHVSERFISCSCHFMSVIKGVPPRRLPCTSRNEVHSILRLMDGTFGEMWWSWLVTSSLVGILGCESRGRLSFSLFKNHLRLPADFSESIIVNHVVQFWESTVPYNIIYSQRRPVGRDFPAYCIWKLAKFGWYPGFWLRGLWVGVLNLSQLTPPVSRKSCRDNRWIIFHLLNSAYCIRVPDGPSAQDHKRHPSIVVGINLNININIYIYI